MDLYQRQKYMYSKNIDLELYILSYDWLILAFWLGDIQQYKKIERFICCESSAAFLHWMFLTTFAWIYIPWYDVGSLRGSEQVMIEQ